MGTKKNYLSHYKEFAKTGRLPMGGLCVTFYGDGFLNLLKPLSIEHPEHYLYSWTGGFWGYDGEPLSSTKDYMERDCQKRGITEDQAMREFTPFRQTILLFMAAMNDEL